MWELYYKPNGYISLSSVSYLLLHVYNYSFVNVVNPLVYAAEEILGNYSTESVCFFTVLTKCIAFGDR